MHRPTMIKLAIGVGCIIAAAILLWPRMPGVASVALDTAEQYELLSLDPERADAPSPDLFHDYRVLGKTVITDRATRARLDKALRGGVKRAFSRVRCFSPRHGIRVTTGGQTTDIVICFECAQVQVWNGSQRIADWDTGASPQPVFDNVLREANVPLPEPE